MKHAYTLGQNVIATTTATEHCVILDKAKATIVRILGDDERDEEVGPMYEINVRMQVFEDELKEI